MKPGILIFLFKICMFLFQMCPVNAIPDADTIGTESFIDTAKSESINSRHSLYWGLGYGSNLIYLGSTISRNQPFGYTALAYGFNEELFASFSGFNLEGQDPYLAFYTISLNYSHVFNSWFDISLGLYRYQVNQSLTEILFNGFTYGDITLGFDWRLIYSKISIGALYSGESQGFLQVKNSRYFQTPSFFNDKVNVSFDPFMNLLFGNLIKTQTDTASHYGVTAPYRPWGKNNNGSTTITSSYSRTFNLIDIEFGLPVSFNFDFMTIEAQASYIFPAYSDKDYPGTEGFVFLLSGFFRIFKF